MYRDSVPEMRVELTRAFARYPLKIVRLPIPPLGQKKPQNRILRLLIRRAKNGTRTRDPNLGKVVLYQLSYFRIFIGVTSC